MKRIFIQLLAIALLFVACNQAEQKKTNEHDGMNHQPKENVMMKAMDISMMAMHKAKQTGNPDYDFASMMIPHHEGAVLMAEEVIKNGKSDSLISFAKKVIEVQKIEIKALQDFLKTTSQVPSKDFNSFKRAMDSSMKPMMDGMEQVKLTGDVDKDFVALMIPHHQSAIDMAKAYLPYSTNELIKNLALQILKAQEKEIIWLKTQ